MPLQIIREDITRMRVEKEFKKKTLSYLDEYLFYLTENFCSKFCVE